MGNLTMLPAGREKIFLLSTAVSAIVNIILNYILIPIWGLNAAAATTVLSQLMGICILWPFMDKSIKIVGLLSMLKAPLIGVAGIMLIGYCAQTFIKSPYLVSIVTISASVILYFSILIIMKNELFLGYIRPIISKFRSFAQKNTEKEQSYGEE